MLNRASCRGLLVILVILLTAGGVASASSITVGLLSFDNLIPDAPGAPGVNVFTVYNFTGSNSFPPDAPVTDSLSFLNTTLTPDGSGGIGFGEVDPGAVQAATLEFPTSTTFGSVAFQADLSSSIFMAGGVEYDAASGMVTASLLPSSGPSLVAGTDFVVLTVDASPVNLSAVPEPPSGWLVLLGGITLLYGQGRISQTRQQQKSNSTQTF